VIDRRWQRKAIPFAWRGDHFDRVRRWRQLRGDRRHNGDWTVPIPYVVLDDDGRPRLLDLVASAGIELHKPDLAATGKLMVTWPWRTS
jgi:hypothetical protein